MSQARYQVCSLYQPVVHFFEHRFCKHIPLSLSTHTPATYASDPLSERFVTPMLTWQQKKKKKIPHTCQFRNATQGR